MSFFPLLRRGLSGLNSCGIGGAGGGIFSAAFTSFHGCSLLFGTMRFVCAMEATRPRGRSFVSCCQRVSVPTVTHATNVLGCPGKLHLFIGTCVLGSVMSSSSSTKRGQGGPISTVLGRSIKVVDGSAVGKRVTLVFDKVDGARIKLRRCGGRCNDFLVASDRGRH